MRTVPGKVAPGCYRNVLKPKRRRWELGLAGWGLAAGRGPQALRAGIPSGPGGCGLCGVAEGAEGD